MSEYGVLLIGGKRTHQESHAPIFGRHPQCELIAVAGEPDEPDFRSGSGRELADTLGIPYISDIDEALSRQDVDIVSSTVHVESRGEVIVRCLEAGKHVYLDKPMAGTIDDIDAIVNTAAKSPGKTQMFSQNNSPWVQEAKKMVDSGRIGKIVSVHAENIFAKGRAGSVLPGTVRKEEEKVKRFTYLGAKREMFDVGIYSLAWIHMITGLSIKSVFALTGNYFFADHASVNVEDFGAMALKLESEVTAIAVGGRFGWSSHPRFGPQRVAIIGTEGTLSADPHRRRIEVYNAEPDFTPPEVDPLDPMSMWFGRSPEYVAMKKERWVPLGSAADPMELDIDQFLYSISNDRMPNLNAAVAGQLSEAILAGYISAAQGEEVSLPLDR